MAILIWTKKHIGWCMTERIAAKLMCLNSQSVKIPTYQISSKSDQVEILTRDHGGHIGLGDSYRLAKMQQNYAIEFAIPQNPYILNFVKIGPFWNSDQSEATAAILV